MVPFSGIDLLAPLIDGRRNDHLYHGNVVAGYGLWGQPTVRHFGDKDFERALLLTSANGRSPMFGLIHFSRQPFHNSNVAGAIGLRLRRWMWSSHHFVCPEKDRFLETADGVTRSGTYQRMVFHAQKNSESGPARPACGIIFSTDASVVAAMNRNVPVRMVER